MKGHVPFRRANEMRALILAALATFGGQSLALRNASPLRFLLIATP